MEDVRSAQEFNSGHVKGSVNIPVGTVIANISKFKNKKQIVVFCRSGSRSAVTKELLNKHEILNVTNRKNLVKIKHLINNKNETSNI